MKCPHCLTDFHDKRHQTELQSDKEGLWQIYSYKCSACEKHSLYLVNYNMPGTGGIKVLSKQLIRPKGTNRPPVPIEVPTNIAEDYTEACLVLADSAKASAALSRRCLQNIIREYLKVKKRDLNAEIQEVIDQGRFSSEILDSIDYLRNIGNFAAHPVKSKSTGEIVEVESEEAEWTLEVLEMIFDYQFVKPTLIQKKRETMNKKLKDAGKPDMK